ncbi:MAG TPA: GNAT family N-acetyltransferase [Clostridia bacterium]
MDVTFREINFENKKDNETAVLLLNEFMNRRDTLSSSSEINISIIEKIKSLGFSKIYLCEHLSNIIGIAVCFRGFSTFKQKELLNIHDFYIRKDFQGKGIGKRFLKYIESECLRNNFCRVTLEVYSDNINAIKLYRKSGFIGNADSENNCLICAMKKDLN